MFWTSTYSTECLLYASHIQDNTHNLYSKIIINKNIFTLAKTLALKLHHDNCDSTHKHILYTNTCICIVSEGSQCAFYIPFPLEQINWK